MLVRIAVLLGWIALPVGTRAQAGAASSVAQLQLQAAALDQADKYSDAEPLYQRALKLDPHSPGLLHNYGNHLLAQGKLDEARQALEQSLQLRPDNVGVMLQLAHIATRSARPQDALTLLDRLPPAASADANVSLIRMQACFEQNQTTEGDSLLNQLLSAGGSNAEALKTIGSALAEAKQFDRAESVFGQAVQVAPRDWDALYALGLSASHAGHPEQAFPVLQKASQQQPRNASALYDLAIVAAETERYETARKTWQAYLVLQPRDELAGREYAFVSSIAGIDNQRALRILRSFVAAHPADAVALYELGAAESPVAPEEALQHLNQALALHPELSAALIARGLLLFRRSDFTAAESDFKLVAARQPTNPRVLDRLGQTYLSLDKLPQAIASLRKAAALAPEDPGVLLHLGRALAKAGEDAESKTVFARLREVQARHKEEL